MNETRVVPVEITDAAIHKMCEYLEHDQEGSPCMKCPAREEIPGHGIGQRACYGLAKEAIAKALDAVAAPQEPQPESPFGMFKCWIDEAGVYHRERIDEKDLYVAHPEPRPVAYRYIMRKSLGVGAICYTEEHSDWHIQHGWEESLLYASPQSVVDVEALADAISRLPCVKRNYGFSDGANRQSITECLRKHIRAEEGGGK